MAKRKAVMKNIIYELDNDDIEISSEEEVNGSRPKVVCLDTSYETTQEILSRSEQNGVEVLSADSTDDSVYVVDSPNPRQNGGKSCSGPLITIDSPDLSKTSDNNSQDEVESEGEIDIISDNTKALSNDRQSYSPSPLCTAGCENRKPLITIRFENNKLLRSYRDKIKGFIINLVRNHKEESQEGLLVADENDFELNIWPEDLTEEESSPKEVHEEEPVDDSLFFVDTAPCKNLFDDIPKYSQVTATISDVVDKESESQKTFRRGVSCFNCDGAHSLRDCTVPKNFARIKEKRQNTLINRVGRYHIEDDQKYGHLIPGRISGRLRHALGLNRKEIPLHVYRMRLLGYPPGWLEEARISHSGINMFDSTGTAILDPEEEDGEISGPGSKDKFDIKKILDFPGFNVPASSKYAEEAHLYGLPPLSEQDSKITMLQMLAPNAMKAYKRKKLTFFPSASTSMQEGQAEMELDSGDEEAEFPSLPPLPDEAPPVHPPPPAHPPPPPPQADSDPNPPEPDHLQDDTADVSTASDLVNTDVIQVSDIPTSDDSLIIIDEDYDTDDCGKVSPTLDDLENKKKILMEALEGNVSTIQSADISISDSTDAIVEEKLNDKEKTDSEKEHIKKENEKSDECEIVVKLLEQEVSPLPDSSQDSNTEIETKKSSPADTVSAAESKGQVKTTLFGAPVLNIASSFLKLPSDDKFSKDICDVIYFENLPNSIGKYKKICSLLKKVKNEVDRIQES